MEVLIAIFRRRPGAPDLLDRLKTSLSRGLPRFPIFGDGLRAAARGIANRFRKSVDLRASEIETIRPYFDVPHYLRQTGMPSVEIGDPVAHYVCSGAAAGFDPCPEFSTGHYVSENGDIAGEGVNPFWHYLVHGKSEGRSGLPQPPDDAADIEADLDLILTAFDPAFYRASHPDVEGDDRDLARHYLEYGWRLGYDPGAGFSTSTYLSDNEDVAGAGLNPLLHYLRFGRDEERPHPSSDRAMRGPVHEDFSRIADAVRDHFDADFYLSTYPDVAAAGMDPLDHYLEAGWREGRDPSRDFSTGYYLDSNPDICQAGVNPFWHYVVAGRNEGRAPRHPGGHAYVALTNMVPLAQEELLWELPATANGVIPVAALRDALSASLSAGRPHLVLSISHDNYRANVGGVQLCIQREEVMSAGFGASYLNIHPLQPRPRLAPADDGKHHRVCLVLNGDLIGAITVGELAEAVRSVRAQAAAVSLVIHQLLGHRPEEILHLAAAAGVGECTYWVHDYFSLCPSSFLLRNDVIHCGAPDISSNACNICRYREERISHLPRMQRLFDELRVHAIFPSKSARRIWNKRAGLATASSTVIPHLTLTATRKIGGPHPDLSAPVRVGFVGRPALHKGWPEFENLVREFQEEGAFEFVYIGSFEVVRHGLHVAHAAVTAEHPDAMIEAIMRERLDIVLQWTSWPETFSIATYEALIGGAYVVTNPASGNVADIVRHTRRGSVLNTMADLVHAFEDGTITAMAHARRKAAARGRLAPTTGNLSFEMIGRGDESWASTPTPVSRTAT